MVKRPIWLYWRSVSRSRVVWVLSVVGLLTVVFFLSACSLGIKSTPTYEPLRVYSAKSVVTKTLAIAHQWQSDAYLFEIHVPVLREGETHPFPIDFTFQSRSDDHHRLIVLCSWNKRCWADSITDAPGGVFHILPIEPGDFIIDSTEAAQIGQRNGGEAFVRRKHSSVFMFVNLTRQGPKGLVEQGPILWRATFSDPVARDHLHVYIDAKTGEVVATRP